MSTVVQTNAEIGHTLANLLDAREVVVAAVVSAGAALGETLDRWRKLCAASESVRTPVFRESAEDLALDCEAIQNALSERQLSFYKASDALACLRILVDPKDEQFSSMVDGVVAEWNSTIQPQLAKLYETSADLEQRIRDLLLAAK